MSIRRLAGLATLAALIALLPADPMSGQPPAKGKPKPGSPLVHDPKDLPKVGDPLSAWALVQRPGPLRNARSWSIETKRHRWLVYHLAARPDGAKVATAGHDGIVRIWDGETGEFERALVGHESTVGGLAWSPDGNYLAAAGHYTTRIWDGKTGLPVRVLRGKYGASLAAWSPDGTRLLTGGGGSGQLAVWDVAAGKQLAETEYGNPVQSIAFSPNGEMVAAAASRAGTYIADALSLKTNHVFKEMLDTDHAVAFSPDGKHLAAGSTKQTVVYDTDSGAVVRKLETPGFDLAWSAKAGLLISGTGYRVAPHTGDTFTAGKPLPGVGSVLSLAADGATLFGLHAGDVTRWDLGTGAAVRNWTVTDHQPLVCGPSTAVIVPGSPPALWEAPTGKRIGALAEHTGGLARVAWAPTGKAVAVSAGNTKIRVYEPGTAKLLRTLTSPAAVTALAVSGDGKVACSSADKKVTLWAAAGDQPTQTLTGFTHPMPLLAWSRDGRLLATGRDKDITVWSAESGKSVKSLEHPRPMHSLTWSTDGGRLVVGSSEDYVLSAYQGSSWKLLPSYDQGTAAIAAVAHGWSPDGAVLVGHRNSAIQLWNGKTGKRGTTIGSGGHVYSMAFWPDGKTVAAGCVDRAARYWDAATGRLRFTAVAERNELVTVGADGHYRCPEAVEKEFVAVVMTDKLHETVPLKEFATRYGFRNVPGNVK